MKILPPRLLSLSAITVLAACESGTYQDGPESYLSRYQALPSETTILQNATVLTGTGERLDDADVLMQDGKIAAVGSDLAAGDAIVVDATGMWITPGVIDVHSHLGNYPSPSVDAHSDGNEATDPNTAEVWPNTVSGHKILALSPHLPAA